MAERSDADRDRLDDGKGRQYAASSASSSSPRIAGAGMLIALQACSRLMTLLMAQLQVRLASAEAFGAAHIHLELLLGTILTFSREGVRNALSRQTASEQTDEADGQQHRQRAIRNVALLPIPLGVLIALVVMALYRLWLAPEGLTSHVHFATACHVFLLGALLELVAEPLYIDALRHLHLGPRVWAEGAGVLAKGASTLAAMVWLQRWHQRWHSRMSKSDLGRSLLPFGIGQLCYGSAFLLVFLLDSIRRNGMRNTVRLYTLQRQTTDKHAMFEGESLKLSVSMTRQNVVKHLLGEADKFAVARLASLSEQGAYALASNYGSLVARLLYQPVEESARLTFATSLGSTHPHKPQHNALDAARSLLRNLLAFYVLLTFFLVTFCPPLTTPLLVVIAGQRWALQTSAARILAVYGSVYLPAMAFNGLLEGFLQACASPAQLSRYDGVLMGASALFVATLTGLSAVRWPGQEARLVSAEVALVLASSLSTWTRALYSYRFARRFLEQSGQGNRGQSGSNSGQAFSLQAILPSGRFAGALVMCAALLYRNAFYIPAESWQVPWSTRAYNHIIMATTFLLIATMACSEEQRTLRGAIEAVRGGRARM